MDASKFDNLLRRLAASGTRRQAIRAIAAGIVTTAAATTAEASSTRRRAVCIDVGRYCTRDGQCCSGNCPRSARIPRASRYHCACPAGLTQCRSHCVDVLTDPHNCGACGTICESGECVAGQCTEPPVKKIYCADLLAASGYGSAVGCYDTYEGDAVMACDASSFGKSWIGFDCTDDAYCASVAATADPRIPGGANCDNGFTCVCVIKEYWGPDVTVNTVIADELGYQSGSCAQVELCV